MPCRSPQPKAIPEFHCCSRARGEEPNVRNDGRSEREYDLSEGQVTAVTCLRCCDAIVNAAPEALSGNISNRVAHSGIGRLLIRRFAKSGGKTEATPDVYLPLVAGDYADLSLSIQHNLLRWRLLPSVLMEKEDQITTTIVRCNYDGG